KAEKQSVGQAWSIVLSHRWLPGNRSAAYLPASVERTFSPAPAGFGPAWSLRRTQRPSKAPGIQSTEDAFPPKTAIFFIPSPALVPAQAWITTPRRARCYAGRRGPPQFP